VLWFLLAIGVIVLLFVSLEQHGITVTDLGTFDPSPLTQNVIVFALLVVVALALLRRRFSQAIKAVLIWLLLLPRFAIGYTYRFELREVADRVMAELFPAMPRPAAAPWRFPAARAAISSC
jgi:aspartyl protease family protein